MMIVELVHLTEQLVSESDLVKSLEKIIEVTGRDFAASLGNFLDIIALVNARMAHFTERSSAKGGIARVYGKECDEQLRTKLIECIHRSSPGSLLLSITSTGHGSHRTRRIYSHFCESHHAYIS